MYAIIATGGKQYRVASGEILKFEKLDAEKGATVEFNQVLMVVDNEKVQIGSPYLPAAKVLGEIVEQKRDEKIRIIKFRRRKHHMKHMGHRQYYTAVKITAIQQ